MNTINDNGPDDQEISEEERSFLEGFGDATEQPAADAGTQSAPAPEGDPAPQETPPAAAAEGIDNPNGGDQPDPEDAWLASLPEEARNRYIEQVSANRNLQRELAQVRNDHAAMAGKLRPLQKQLESLQRGTAAPSPQPAPQPEAPQTVEQLDALVETEEFKEWAQAFPEEAKVWKSQQSAMLKAAEQIAQRQVAQVRRELEERFGPVVNRVERQHQQMEREERIAKLEAAHPDWRQHSDSDDFANWFNDEYLPSLPEDMQAKYSDDNEVIKALRQPQFAIRVLTEYKRDRGLTTAAPTPQPTGQPSAARAPTPAHQPAPTARNPRLALSQAPSVGREPGATRIPLESMDPESAFLAGFNSGP